MVLCQEPRTPPTSPTWVAGTQLARQPHAASQGLISKKQDLKAEAGLQRREMWASGIPITPPNTLCSRIEILCFGIERIQSNSQEDQNYHGIYHETQTPIRPIWGGIEMGGPWGVEEVDGDLCCLSPAESQLPLCLLLVETILCMFLTNPPFYA